VLKRLVIPAALAALFAAAPATAEPLALKLGTWGPPTSFFYVDVIDPWIERVNRDSQGTLAIKHYGASVLADQRRMYDAVKNNIATIGWVTPGTAPGRFVKTTITELPFGLESGELASIAYWRMYETGLIADEYNDVKLLGTSIFPGASLMTRRKKVSTLEDLAGLKFRISGAMQGSTVKALGGTPVSLPVDELYQALDKGIVDGFAASLTAYRPFRLGEVTRYHVDVNLNAANSALMMNKEAFDKLPAAAKAAIDKHSGEVLSREFGLSNDREVVRAREDLQKRMAEGKTETYKLAPAEEQRWRERTNAVVEEWTKNTPDGARILDGYRGIATEVSKAR
jgi:TRAP-type C4-dicarboxylate transport system substrate-binding protein